MSKPRRPPRSHLPSTPLRSADPTGSSELLSPTLARFSKLDIKDTPVHGLRKSAANPEAQTPAESRSKAAFEMEAYRIKLPYEKYMTFIQSESNALDVGRSLQDLPEDFKLPGWVTMLLADKKTFGRGEKKMYPPLVRGRYLSGIGFADSHLTVWNHTGRHRPRAP